MPEPTLTWHVTPDTRLGQLQQLHRQSSVAAGKRPQREPGPLQLEGGAQLDAMEPTLTRHETTTFASATAASAAALIVEAVRQANLTCDHAAERRSPAWKPVNLGEVLDLWPNLRVVTTGLDHAGYLLDYHDLGGDILINSRDGAARQRFTIAHELGHWLLNRLDLPDLAPPHANPAPHPYQGNGGTGSLRDQGKDTRRGREAAHGGVQTRAPSILTRAAVVAGPDFGGQLGVPSGTLQGSARALEEWCDQFAANLLVSDETLGLLKRLAPSGILEVLDSASEELAVSNTVLLRQAAHVTGLFFVRVVGRGDSVRLLGYGSARLSATLYNQILKAHRVTFDQSSPRTAASGSGSEIDTLAEGRVVLRRRRGVRETLGVVLE